MISCICEHCHSEKRAKFMHSPTVCNLCQKKVVKREQATQGNRDRVLLRHEHLRKTGLICTRCNEHRSYNQFPVNARTGRIMELKPCFVCVTPKNVCMSCERGFPTAKSLIMPHQLCYDCNQARLESIRRSKRCGMCTTMKLVTDFEANTPFCRDCAKSFEQVSCYTCNKNFSTPDMMPPERKECVYCVVRRNHHEDMMRLREYMRQDKILSQKIADFIKLEYKKFLT